MKDKGMYIGIHKGTLRVRVPNQESTSFHLEAIHAAIDERDRLCKLEGLDPYAYPLSKKGGRLGRESQHKIHTDLPLGVTRVIDKTRYKRGYKSIIALVNTPFQKKFSYGGIRTETEAIEKAIRWADNHRHLLKK